MKYDPINKLLVEDNKVEVKDSKTQDLDKPYFDPLYKDTRRAIVKEVEKYLASKGYNNSTGKYDKVVFGVRSLLERTLLQPGTDKFNNAVHQEVDRLWKKYSLTKDSKTKDVYPNVDSLFNKADLRWKIAKKGIKEAIEKTNDISELSKIHNNINTSYYGGIIEDYNYIWNKVGEIAQERRNTIVDELSEYRQEALNKIKQLKKENK